MKSIKYEYGLNNCSFSYGGVMRISNSLYTVESLEFLMAKYVWHSWVALVPPKFTSSTKRVIFHTESENQRIHKITSPRISIPQQSTKIKWFHSI